MKREKYYYPEVGFKQAANSHTIHAFLYIRFAGTDEANNVIAQVVYYIVDNVLFEGNNEHLV